MASVSRQAAREMARPILSLYREVLKLHRERLPAPMRDLGDSYARAEFRSVLHAKTTPTMVQWTAFVNEWKGYISTLRGEEHSQPSPNLAVTSELVSGVYDSLSPDQRKRVEQLRKELADKDEGGEGKHQ